MKFCFVLVSISYWQINGVDNCTHSSLTTRKTINLKHVVQNYVTTSLINRSFEKWPAGKGQTFVLDIFLQWTIQRFIMLAIFYTWKKVFKEFNILLFLRFVLPKLHVEVNS